MKNILFVLSIVFFISNTKAQSLSKSATYPTIGQICPKLIIRNIENFKVKNFSTDQQKGKWLILDFWSKQCGSCVASFPKMSSLQEEFSSDIQIVLVGIEDKQNEIRPLFQRFQEKLNLKVPSAFDSTLFKKLDIGAVPYIIIINPDGIVKGITSNLNKSNIADLIAGKSPSLPRAYRDHEMRPTPDYIFEQPFLVNGNGGNDSMFLYRSLLTKRDSSLVLKTFTDSRLRLNFGKFEAINVPLSLLYMYAYLGRDHVEIGGNLYGKVWPKPIIETKDTTDFTSGLKMFESMYSYSLKVPESKGDSSHLMKIMQRDLKNYFDYQCSIETRKMPYWRLIATDEARVKLKTKSKANEQTKSSSKNASAGLSEKNFPINVFIRSIAKDDIPYIDETGINGNIDIRMDCIMTVADEIKKGLHANGLDLVKGEKEMKVLVIRDAKPDTTTTAN